MLYNPNVIVQILSTQNNYIDKLYGQMFYYTDTNQIWYDTQNKGRIQASDIVILQFERERTNYVPSASKDFPSETDVQIPSSYLDYVIVYVIETNSLYKYQKGIWFTLYGKYGSNLVAQTYLPDGTIKTVNADDVTTNGILNDGSVVIRDNNKMICGLLRSDGYTFDIQSLIGGCLNLDPSGYSVGKGCLQLVANSYSTNASQQSEANFNANLNVFGNINILSPDNWDKQYRLVTENLTIDSTSTIVAGSTIKAGSTLGNTKYSVDTRLTSDVTVDNGLIVTNSKLYKNSVINNAILVSPFLFDLENMTVSTTPITTVITDFSIANQILTINTDININNGDCIILSSTENITTITSVIFKGVENKNYTVDYMSRDGITTTARLIFYPNNKVKVLP